jgi:hypothetical protein
MKERYAALRGARRGSATLLGIVVLVFIFIFILALLQIFLTLFESLNPLARMPVGSTFDLNVYASRKHQNSQ